MRQADLILINGKIFCGLHDGFAEALAVRAGRVLFTGANEDVRAAAGPRTKVIDLAGRTAVPAFNDAHQHLTLVGLGLSELNLRADSGVRSIDELLSRIRSEAKRLKPGAWLKGRGYDHNELAEKRHPTIAELDAAAPNNPVYIARACTHIAMVNNAALMLAGVTVETADPQGGLIGRDGDRLTGLLSETAKQFVLDVMPVPGVGELTSAIALAGKALLAQGFTATTDMAVGISGAGIDEVLAYEALAASGGLPIRTWLSYQGAPYGDSPAMRAYDAGYRPGRQVGLLRHGGVKLFADGTVGGTTAAFTKPYVGQPDNFGLYTYSDAEMHHGLRRFHDLGYQLTIHAIGDGGIEQTLSGIEAIAGTSPVFARRHRIEHCGFVRNDQLHRMAKLGVLPAPQPVFIYEFANLYEAVLGKARTQGAYPMRKFWDAGLFPSASSDAPVCTTNPAHGLYAMIARRTAHDTLYGEDQRLSVAEAIHAYTFNAAYSSFQEQITGRLVPDQRADIAVFGLDIFAATPEEIRDHLVCELTILGGEIVFGDE